jgi:hypothetical protein
MIQAASDSRRGQTFDYTEGKRKGEKTMLITGTVSNGVIVLDQPGALPEGTRVVVETEKKQPTLGRLLKYAGILEDMPSDFAQQHDHYIHRTPKR